MYMYVPPTCSQHVSSAYIIVPAHCYIFNAVLLVSLIQPYLAALREIQIALQYLFQ